MIHSKICSAELRKQDDKFDHCESVSYFEQFWIHAPIETVRAVSMKLHKFSLHLTEPGHQASQLNESSDSFQNAHMSPANFLDEFQLRILRDAVT